MRLASRGRDSIFAAFFAFFRRGGAGQRGLQAPGNGRGRSRINFIRCLTLPGSLRALRGCDALGTMSGLDRRLATTTPGLLAFSTESFWPVFIILIMIIAVPTRAKPAQIHFPVNFPDKGLRLRAVLGAFSRTSSGGRRIAAPFPEQSTDDGRRKSMLFFALEARLSE